MMTAIASLRDIARCCRTGAQLPADQARFLADALDRFLAHRAPSLEAALGLRFPRGGVPWWREEAMRRRDAALRALAERHHAGETVTARARAIAVAARRYAATAWREDAHRDAMPAHYAGTPREGLYRAFASGAPMPLGERQLRTILGK